MRCEISYAGIECTVMPDDLPAQIPRGRWNYFEVPWNASCPGTGHILVTSDQLSRMVQATDSGHNPGELKLTCFTNDDKGQEIVDEPGSVTLKKIYMMTAVPLHGNFFRKEAIELDAEGLPAPTVVAEDTDTNSEGVWVLELADFRVVAGKDYHVEVSNGSFNVENPPYDGSKFVRETVNTPLPPPDPGTPWKLHEIISKLMPLATGSLVGYSWEWVPSQSEQLISDIFIAGIPTLMAVDLLLNASHSFHVVKYDPSEADGTKFFITNTRENYREPIQKNLHRRITGGFHRHYYHRKQTIHPIYRNRAAVDPGFRDYYGASGSQTSVAVNVPFVSGTKTVANQPAAHGDAYKGVFMGFCKDFLNPRIPISLVVFDWAHGVPTTEVNRTLNTPIRSLLESRMGHFLRDVPLRVAINGDIGVPDALGGGTIFVSTLVQCDRASGYGKISLSGAEVIVYLAKGTFPNAGDEVWISPLTGDPKAKYAALPVMKGFDFDPPPTGSLIAVNLPARTTCADSV